MSFNDLLHSAKTMVRRFFGETDEETREDVPQQEDAQQSYQQQAQQQTPQYTQYQQPMQQQPYQQAQPQTMYQQAGYNQQGMYSAPQQPYQNMQQPYQQQAPQQAPQQAAPQQQGGIFGARNRRTQHAQMQQDENVVQFPGTEPQQQDAAQMPQAQPLTARVINARNIMDCRSAITYLRDGDAVIVSMDSIADQAEMRRYVDMLSGACFSLCSTLTRLSRYGVYLIAPSAVTVYTDQTTNQMNNQRMAQQRANAYAQPQPQQPTYDRAAYRTPMQEEAPAAHQQPNMQPRYRAQPQYSRQQAAPQQFYQRQPDPEPEQDPNSFSYRPNASGYVPDQMNEMADAQ